ncbi:MAG: PAC2 family protein [Candidatus Asgardarchaeia archaeon]
MFRELKFIKENDLREPIAILGLPGIGLVGKVCVDTIIEAIKPEKVAELYSPDFPPRVLVDGDGFPRSLKTEIFLWKNEKAKKDIFLITADAQPQTVDGQFKFAREILDYLASLGVKLVVACAANDIGREVKEPKVHVVSTNREVLKEFLKSKIAVTFRHGGISGGNGMIPVLAHELYGIDGVCLLAETSRLTERFFTIDPKASKAIVNVLNEALGLNVPTDKLDEKIEEIEETIKKFRERAGEKRKEGGEERPYIS